MASKKNCSNCHKRHYHGKKVCECGCSYFISDSLVISKYYREGMTGNDLVRKLNSKGFSLSQPIVVARMRDLGFKNNRQMQQDKQTELKNYLEGLTKRPSGAEMARKFGMQKKTAYNIICRHFPSRKKGKENLDKSERVLLDGYMQTYQKFIDLPKSKQTVFERNKIVCEINTLKKYRMI